MVVTQRLGKGGKEQGRRRKEWGEKRMVGAKYLYNANFTNKFTGSISCWE